MLGFTLKKEQTPIKSGQKRKRTDNKGLNIASDVKKVLGSSDQGLILMVRS